jgi:hypothetical protein
MKLSGKLLISLFLFISTARAQSVFTSAEQLNFGPTFETLPSSLPLKIYNTLTRTVTATGIKFYNIYGSPAFSASSNWFDILPGDSAEIWITFSPRHNIFHNTEMVIENDGLAGYLVVDLKGQGKFSNSYYNACENLIEESLKTAISNIVNANYISLGYNVARDSMFMSIDNKKVNGLGASQNTIECVYTGREAIGYSSRTDCQNNFSFNTEHTFPQSYFSSLEPMRSDLHHLFPTDNTANNVRADFPFSEVTNPSWSVGGSSSDGNLFEPRDVQKGITARAMLYFVLAYQNYGSYVNTAQENWLRNWHALYPPLAQEKIRNNAINSMQHNRNPFVDYPQFSERIHSFISNSVEPVVSSIDIPEDTAVFGYVSVSNTVRHAISIVNNGNTTVQFSSIQLSNPLLTFVRGGVDTSVSPGDALRLVIEYTALNADSVRAFLTLNTNVASHNSISIPLFINDNVFNELEESKAKNFFIFPNPADDRIFFSNALSGKVEVYDEAGRKIFSEIGSMLHSVDVAGLTEGFYILAIESGDEKYRSPFLVK